LSIVDLVYLYGFAVVFIIVSVPYIVKPGRRVLDGKRLTLTGMRRILWGMALQTLSLNYLAYARGDGLLFPLQHFQSAGAIIPERFYQITTTLLEVVSLIYMIGALFGRKNKGERFGLAVFSSLLFVVNRIIGL